MSGPDAIIACRPQVPGAARSEQTIVTDKGFRVERDSMGELKVPADALWGAQTQRAVENFPISGLTLPRAYLRALGLVKWAAARGQRTPGAATADVAEAIRGAALEVAAGAHDAQFPIDVFQTGSGTSTNMNANEVIAHLASRAPWARRASQRCTST